MSLSVFLDWVVLLLGSVTFIYSIKISANLLSNFLDEQYVAHLDSLDLSAKAFVLAFAIALLSYLVLFFVEVVVFYELDVQNIGAYTFYKAYVVQKQAIEGFSVSSLVLAFLILIPIRIGFFKGLLYIADSYPKRTRSTLYKALRLLVSFFAFAFVLDVVPLPGSWSSLLFYFALLAPFSYQIRTIVLIVSWVWYLLVFAYFMMNKEY